MRVKPRLLIIEDEPDILELLQYNLQREGFEVLTERDGQHAVGLAQKKHPDLILLDLMLPSVGGLDICRSLKSDETTKKIPIIMVTAKGEESDVILGLELGADDYVSKPFSPRELIARIRAVLRRVQSKLSAEERERIQLGTLSVDSSRYEVFVKDQPVLLTRAEFRLLKALAGQPGRVLTRDQLLDQVTGGSSVVIDRNVDVHIGALRKKLGQEGKNIQTVRGIGYKYRD